MFSCHPRQAFASFLQQCARMLLDMMLTLIVAIPGCRVYHQIQQLIQPMATWLGGLWSATNVLKFRLSFWIRWLNFSIAALQLWIPNVDSTSVLIEIISHEFSSSSSSLSPSPPSLAPEAACDVATTFPSALQMLKIYKSFFFLWKVEHITIFCPFWWGDTEGF